MTNTDEEIMQAAREEVARFWVDQGDLEFARAAKLGDLDEGAGVRVAVFLIRFERARTQAIAAAAWAAWRDAVIYPVQSLLSETKAYGATLHHDQYQERYRNEGQERILNAIIHDIRALSPPAEFAAPEDTRDAEIARLRAQVSERDALLREARCCDVPPDVAVRIDALLSKTEGE